MATKEPSKNALYLSNISGAAATLLNVQHCFKNMCQACYKNDFNNVGYAYNIVRNTSLWSLQYNIVEREPQASTFVVCWRKLSKA